MAIRDVSGFPYMYAWGLRACKVCQVSIAAGNQDSWVDLEYMLSCPQN